jgi:hypothetical protein
MLERLERFEAVVNDYADSRAGSDDEQLAEAALSRQWQTAHRIIESVDSGLARRFREAGWQEGRTYVRQAIGIIQDWEELRTNLAVTGRLGRGTVSEPHRREHEY